LAWVSSAALSTIVAMFKDGIFCQINLTKTLVKGKFAFSILISAIFVEKN